MVKLIKDRGTIKWTAMMLPEHVSMIKKVWEQDEKMIKPILDCQQLQEMNETINEALEFNLPLVFTYYSDGKLNNLIGHIHYVDPINHKLRVKDKFDDMMIVSVEDIVQVTIH